MKVAFISVILAGSSCAWSVQNDIEAECDGPDSGTFYQACVLAKNTKVLNAELNVTYQRQLDQYTKDGASKERKLLVESQRAWLQYLDKTCEFENQAIGGINAISWARCQERMVAQRLAYLKDL